MVNRRDFDPAVPLPSGLTIAALAKAIDHIESQTATFIELYHEQPNVFSAIVGIFGTLALDTHSDFEKSKHSTTAQQRFPDLCRRGISAGKRGPNHCLESKGSKRGYAIQSHYNHPGWYVVWRYLIDPTEQIEAGKPVIIWRVDVVFLTEDDWKYEGSKAATGVGGRTHTFGVKAPKKRLRGTAAFQRRDIVLRGGKPVSREVQDDE